MSNQLQTIAEIKNGTIKPSAEAEPQLEELRNAKDRSVDTLYPALTHARQVRDSFDWHESSLATDSNVLERVLLAGLRFGMPVRFSAS